MIDPSATARRWLRAFFLGLVILSGGPAWAGDTAESLIAEGVELRRLGQDAEALSKFEKAYTQSSTPRAAAQWGLCLQALGRWSEAEARLSEALKARGDRWVQKNREVLRDSLEAVKANVARVEVNGGPDGALVTINGREAGTMPLQDAVVVNAGAVDIEVTKAGFARGYRSLSLSGGQYQRVLIRLEESLAPSAPVASAAANPLPTTPSDGFESVSAQETQLNDAEPAGSPVYKKAWFWGVVGAVVAASVVAVALSGGGGTTPGPEVDDTGTYNPGAQP
ncbi:MAG: PEGA domain-containing protein [Myxococcales bacterium]|nr:PEGA domain-containing protein [Myxococcales bacterium]